MDLEPTFAEKEEPVPIGVCCQCYENIMCWEDHYDVDGDLLHDECGLDYLKKYRKYA